MIDLQSYDTLKTEINNRIRQDMSLLDNLRTEVQQLRSTVRQVQPRMTTSISLVGTDGGNNRIQFDPFLVQLVRVVDSSNNEYCLEAITPTTSVTELSRMQFDDKGVPITALGKMMGFLNVQDLTRLSHMIRRNDDDRPSSPSWVQVYRELMEWAVLFTILTEKEFGTDTIIVHDGLLRSKVFAKELFIRLSDGFKQAIESHKRKHRRNIYLVGLAKHSKVLDRYRLAMSLEHILTAGYPCYTPIPRDLEKKAYIWAEYARGDDVGFEGGEVNKFVAGKMFFVKFGSRSNDPVWPVDIFVPQEREAGAILGCLLSDANNGFPVPFYPMCLQKAHENAALVDFDFDIIQDQVLSGLRTALGSESHSLDEFQLRDADPAQRRY